MISENDSYSSQFKIKIFQIGTKYFLENSYFKLKYEIFHILRSDPAQTSHSYFSATVKVKEIFLFYFSNVFSFSLLIF